MYFKKNKFYRILTVYVKSKTPYTSFVNLNVETVTSVTPKMIFSLL